MLFVIVYLLVPIAMLMFFGTKKPAHSWLAIIICPMIDVLFFYQDFMYYESNQPLKSDTPAAGPPIPPGAQTGPGANPAPSRLCLHLQEVIMS